MINERITLGVLALTFLMPWTLRPDASVVAAEKPAPNIPPAKSCVYTVVQQLGVDSTLPAETMKVYWAAPGKSRSEAYEGSEPSGTTISSTSGPGITINHTFKTYQVLPAQPSSRHMGPGFFDERLGQFAGQADRDLGTRQIGDRPARGFEIAMAKIDPDMPPGIARIWVDQQSGLPVEMEYAFEARGERVAMRLKDIRWNVELDPKLFEPVAPEGYVKRPRHQPPMEEQLRSIIKALRIYVEIFGDHYPRVTRVQPGRLQDEMFKKVLIDPAAPPSEQRRSDHHKKILVATNGFGWLYRILAEVPDAAYYGKTVGPNDKNRVLARWRLDDGKYQVIYGDLRTETVTAENLGLDAPETDEAGAAPAERSGPVPALATLAGFNGDVRFALFTTDDRRLLAGGHDKLVRVFDLQTGELPRTLQGHAGGITCGAVSPDSKMLATGSWDKTVRLWDIESGKEAATLLGHEVGVRGLAFSPDGKLLASAGGDKVVRLWDVIARKELRTLPAQDRAVNSVAISPDGSMLATATGNWKEPEKFGEVKLWDLTTGKELQTLADYSSLYYGVSFSPDGKVLAFSDTRGWVRLWDVARRSLIAEMKSPAGVLSIAFIPEGNLLATSHYRGGVFLWNVSTGDLRVTYEGHDETAYAVASSADGTVIVTGGADDKARIWSTPNDRGGDATTVSRIRRWAVRAPDTQVDNADARRDGASEGESHDAAG